MTSEGEGREILAKGYRLFHWLGWSEAIFTHLSLRVGATDTFLIAPFGVPFDEITPENLVKVDAEGNTFGAGDRRPSPAGFIVHGAVHTRAPHAKCVLHTHTTAVMAVASSELGLECSNFYAAQLHGEVGYHAFEGIVLRPEEGPRLAGALGAGHALVLRNHGVLVVGETFQRAFAFLWTLQRACEVQLAGAALGPRRLIGPEIAASCRREAFQFEEGLGIDVALFDALVRQMERAGGARSGGGDR